MRIMAYSVAMQVSVGRRFSQRINATVDADTWEIMRAEQERLGCTTSQLIRYAVRAFAICGGQVFALQAQPNREGKSVDRGTEQ